MINCSCGSPLGECDGIHLNYERMIVERMWNGGLEATWVGGKPLG